MTDPIPFAAIPFAAIKNNDFMRIMALGEDFFKQMA